MDIPILLFLVRARLPRIPSRRAPERAAIPQDTKKKETKDEDDANDDGDDGNDDGSDGNDGEVMLGGLWWMGGGDEPAW